MVDWSDRTWIGPWTPAELRRQQSFAEKAAAENAAAEATAAEQAAACGYPTGWRRHCRRHPYGRRHSDLTEMTAAEQAAAEMASRPSRPRGDCRIIDYPWQFREIRADMTDLAMEQARFWNLCLAQYIVQLWDDHERKRDTAVEEIDRTVEEQDAAEQAAAAEATADSDSEDGAMTGPAATTPHWRDCPIVGGL